MLDLIFRVVAIIIINSIAVAVSADDGLSARLWPEAEASAVVIKATKNVHSDFIIKRIEFKIKFKHIIIIEASIG